MSSPDLRKPQSAVSVWTGVVGLSALALTCLCLWAVPGLTALEECFFLLANMIASMALYEIFVVGVHRRAGAGLNWGDMRGKIMRMMWARDFWIKLAGGVLSLGFFAFVWNLPLYREDYYQPFFDMLRFYAVLIAVAGALYMPLVHAAMVDKRDGFWHLGACCVPSLWGAIDEAILKNHALSLAVKAFFLPLMFVFLYNQWGYLRGLERWPDTLAALFDAGARSLFFVDVAFAVVGYICTFRLLDAHIRHTETQWGGWVVCLACYAPFNQIIFDRFLSYSDGLRWQGFLESQPVLFALWGAAILLFYGIYVIATVNFGFRFSNLTNRGVLTHGMYAYTKHPAYLSKNISWWLESMPFLFMGAAFMAGALHCVILAIVGYIYYLRAKYEENIMAQTDNTYRLYADYINRHGVAAQVVKGVRGRFRG